MAASQVAFGAVPDWVAAIGTTLAFFVAFVVLTLDRRERRRRQAGQVSAWFERGESKADLHVLNSSETPVYNVRVTPQLAGSSWDVIRLPLIGPKSNLIIPPAVELPGIKDVSNEFLGVRISFQDAEGRRWERARNGKLHRKWTEEKNVANLARETDVFIPVIICAFLTLLTGLIAQNLPHV